MDGKVKARFYQVENVSGTDATFFDALHRLWGHPQRREYEKIYGGARVRIENFEADHNIVGQGFVDGEFVRQQTDGLPPFAEEGEDLEGNERPLGHRCAFRYNPRLNVLLLESRRESVTPIRIDALVKARLNSHRGFFLSPVLSQDAVDQLRNGTPRKVSFRVARPADMAAEEDDEEMPEANLARLSNYFGGPNVTVTVGFGRGDRDGSLLRRSIREATRWATGNRAHVEAFRVRIAESEEPIDIFAEQLEAGDTLDLDNRNIARNYATRRESLPTSLSDHLPILRRMFAGE